MLNLIWQELRMRNWSILIWGLALCMFPAIYIGLYPSFADQMANFQDMLDLEFYRVLGISGMATFEAYMASTVNNLLPVILSVYAVSAGIATLAGEEEDGRLETIVALPLPRWQIVTAKAIVLGISLFVILLIVGAGTALIVAYVNTQVETGVSTFQTFTNLLAMWPLEMALAMISLFLGAFCSTRRIAGALGVLVVAASFLGNNLTGMISSLESLQWLFLFHYYDASPEAVLNGQSWSDMLILLAVALVFYGLAVFFFGRRDITVGQWPWQRGRVPATIG